MPEGGEPLTERETETLIYVLAGLRNREIARRMCITRSTVKKHIHRAFEKLHVHSRGELAMLVVRCAGLDWPAETARTLETEKPGR